MGWSKELHANKDIRVSDVQAAIDTLPEHLKGRQYESDSFWGLTTDIYKPDGAKLRISGAWFSVEFATGIMKDRELLVMLHERASDKNHAGFAYYVRTIINLHFAEHQSVDTSQCEKGDCCYNEANAKNRGCPGW